MWIRFIVFTRASDSKWTSSASSGGGRRLAEVDHGHIFDTLISLVDLRTGRTVASTRVPEAFLTAAGAPDLFFSTSQDEFGDVVTKVLQLKVRRP